MIIYLYELKFKPLKCSYNNYEDYYFYLEDSNELRKCSFPNKLSIKEKLLRKNERVILNENNELENINENDIENKNYLILSHTVLNLNPNIVKHTTLGFVPQTSCSSIQENEKLSNPTSRDRKAARIFKRDSTVCDGQGFFDTDSTKYLDPMFYFNKNTILFNKI